MVHTPPPSPQTLRLRLGLPAEMTLVRDIDNDACDHYASAGLPVELAADHPFTVDEQARWTADAAAGRLYMAELSPAEASGPVGFLCYHWVDGVPYLDQLSVRRAFMRRGIGTTMIGHAKAWAATTSTVGELWLTTYDHIPWNRPYYTHQGFEVVPEADCGPEIRAILKFQRESLPAPEARIAMRFTRGGAR